MLNLLDVGIFLLNCQILIGFVARQFIQIEFVMNLGETKAFVCIKIVRTSSSRAVIKWKGIIKTSVRFETIKLRVISFLF